MAFLARVDPNSIAIDPNYVRPSEWDSVAVLDDLRAYLTVARLLKATPVLEVVHGLLRLVSGEPFVRAAREAQPPLPEIVCLIKTEIADGEKSSLIVPVSRAELMEEHSERDVYETFEMLSFVSPVIESNKAQIEQEIYRFLAMVHEHPTRYGGSYGRLFDLRWDDKAHRVSWIWQRNDEPGRHQQLFLDVLRKIDTEIAPLQSWNGLTLNLSN